MKAKEEGIGKGRRLIGEEVGVGRSGDDCDLLGTGRKQSCYVTQRNHMTRCKIWNEVKFQWSFNFNPFHFFLSILSLLVSLFSTHPSSSLLLCMCLTNSPIIWFYILGTYYYLFFSVSTRLTRWNKILISMISEYNRSDT